MANLTNVLGWFSKNNDYLDNNNSYNRRMKLLKLLFLSHGFYESIYGKKLFVEKFEAWRDGPVDNEAYAKHVNGQYNFNYDIDIFNKEEIRIMEKVNSVYGIYSGEALSSITHQFSSWLDTYEEDENGNPLPPYVLG